MAPRPQGSVRSDRLRAWLTIGIGLIVFVLVPFLLFERRMNEVTAHTWGRSAAAPLAVAARSSTLLALDIVLPVPSSAVSTAAGALLGFWPGLAASMLGMTLCCQLGYGIGRTCGRAVAVQLVREQVLESVAVQMRARAELMLGAMRAIPVAAEASVLLAGVTRLNLARFTAITCLANLGVSAAYAAIGAAAFQSGSPGLLFAGIVILPAVVSGLVNCFSRGTGRMAVWATAAIGQAVGPTGHEPETLVHNVTAGITIGPRWATDPGWPGG